MELLAEKLRRIHDDTRQALPALEEEQLITRLRRAREVADQMILELPVFLIGLSKRTWRRAYICELHYGYCCGAGIPDHQLPKSLRDPTGKTFTTPSQCQRHLFGIPRFVAMWAVEQGMRAKVEKNWLGPDAAIFRKTSEGMPSRFLQRGLILSW